MRSRLKVAAVGVAGLAALFVGGTTVISGAATTFEAEQAATACVVQASAPGADRVRGG